MYNDEFTVSSVVAVKVNKRLKEAMRRYSNRVDWPSEIRTFIMEKIRRLEAEENLERVVKMLEETRSVEEGFSLKAVREDRDSH